MQSFYYLYLFAVLVDFMASWGVAALMQTIGLLRHRYSKRIFWTWAIVYFLITGVLSVVTEISSEGGRKVFISTPFWVLAAIGGLSHLINLAVRKKYSEAFTKSTATTNRNSSQVDQLRNTIQTTSSIPVVSGRVFISYRRSDSADIAGRIYDRLVDKFGKELVFKDVDSIPLGVDFKEYLGMKVGECKVLLAIIGDHWVDASDATGKKRLDDPADFVRVEIEFALERGITVIPLVVRGAQMPIESNLPASLSKLVYKNGIQIRPDPDFHHDMDRLISALEKQIQ
jgi:TIR domain